MMSIFIANLAFVGNAGITNASKMAILFASLIAGVCGFLWLKFLGRQEAGASPTDEIEGPAYCTFD